ncbi:hypothetical protein V8V75_09770, partial [Peribacillus frigoritolerans]|uniref:hypothetical protein n=1 Tax=Peribacillus frigoritolerans TaxID=450367 RepID=UPI00300B19C2
SSYSEPYLRLVYPSSFSPVLLNGWKKYATLLPNNWLAETPQALALMRLGRQSAERERVSEINWKFFCLQLEILKYFHQSGRLLHLYVFLHHLNVDRHGTKLK